MAPRFGAENSPPPIPRRNSRMVRSIAFQFAVEQQQRGGADRHEGRADEGCRSWPESVREASSDLRCGRDAQRHAEQRQAGGSRVEVQGAVRGERDQEVDCAADGGGQQQGEELPAEPPGSQRLPYGSGVSKAQPDGDERDGRCGEDDDYKVGGSASCGWRSRRSTRRPRGARSWTGPFVRPPLRASSSAKSRPPGEVGRCRGRRVRESRSRGRGPANRGCGAAPWRLSCPITAALPRVGCRRQSRL